MQDFTKKTKQVSHSFDLRYIARREDTSLGAPCGNFREMSPPLMPQGSLGTLPDQKPGGVAQLLCKQQRSCSRMLSHDNASSMRTELCPVCDGGNEMHITVLQSRLYMADRFSIPKSKYNSCSPFSRSSQSANRSSDQWRIQIVWVPRSGGILDPFPFVERGDQYKILLAQSSYAQALWA
jgi:hypothetical protein